MNLFKLKGINIFYVILIILALIQYFLLTPLNTASDASIPTIIDLDYKIKLIPGFIIPYLSVYILLFLVFTHLLLKNEGHEATIFLFSVIILWSLVNLAHGFLPTTNLIRPEIKETGFFFNAVDTLYQSVKPYCTLPSWTAATAILCVICFYKIKYKGWKYILIWVILISISPLFLKMSYLLDIVAAIPLPFISYFLAEKFWNLRVKSETVHEVVKVFTLESLVQSVAIGIRDENTISSLIERLNLVEKNLKKKDNDEIKHAGVELNPPVESLKAVIDNLTSSLNFENYIENAKEMFGQTKSYTPSDSEIKLAGEKMLSDACLPFEDYKFRNAVLGIKKRNTELINTTSIEEAAKERANNIIFRFNSFIDTHKKSIPALKMICNSTNGHSKLSLDEVKAISKELRKPPYEISADEIWNSYYRINNENVKPLGELKNPANIIALTQFAVGKIDNLEPFEHKVDKRFEEWLNQTQANSRKFTEEEIDWLVMMKNHIASSIEVSMTSFNQAPFANKGGASKAYNLFGPELNRILIELNEKLV